MTVRHHVPHSDMQTSRGLKLTARRRGIEDREVIIKMKNVLPTLREQASLFARLERFAVRQRELIGLDDTGPLLALLTERRHLSMQLADVAERLRPIRDAWSSYRKRLASEEQREADRLLFESTECLRRVMEADEQDVRRLQAKKQMVAQDLQRADSTDRAMRAYGGARATFTMSIDEAL